MPITEAIEVRKLKLDLGNYRTVRQPNEQAAIKAMISINPEWFWALATSLIDEGYHPTENILLLRGGKSGKDLIVKEGNRRVGALKLVFGFLSSADLAVPADVLSKIETISKDWKSTNHQVPCAIYNADEEDKVDRIITLTHAKGERASRDNWKSIAKARHNRDKGGGAEYGLDILEKYLSKGANVTEEQAVRWAGDYPLSVFDEAIKRIAPRTGHASSRELAEAYPKISPYKLKMEKLLLAIGLKQFRFEHLRGTDDVLSSEYGFPTVKKSVPAETASEPTTKSDPSPAESNDGKPTSSSQKTTKTPLKTATKRSAYANNDPRTVIRELKAFLPKGPNRSKLVTLLNEAKLMDLKRQPHAFCFLLRSMFEMSAKAYCDDHAQANGPKTKKPNGEDRPLVEVLRDVTNHLTSNKQDKATLKVLHGAMAELGKPDGFLSVTSFNQLVHNPKFSVDETHISTLFSNIFPLLTMMNS